MAPGAEAGLLGDLARALTALRPGDDATAQAMARSLGLEIRPPALAAPDGSGGEGTPLPTGDEALREAAAVSEAEGQKAREIAEGRWQNRLRPGRRTAEPMASRLVAISADEPGSLPARLDRALPLEAAVDAGAPLALEPLLVDRWTPGILSAALARDGRDGPVDMLALTDRVARRELVTALPRRPRLTLGAGAQVLVDAGDAMLPFRGDVAALVARVRRVAGDDRVAVLRFSGSPLRCGPGGRSTWRTYTPPEPPRGVLALTTFGRDGQAPVAHWLALAAAAAAAECRLVILAACTAARVPPQIRRAIPVLEWDRATSLQSVARKVRGR
jgi:hypothetical protein